MNAPATPVPTIGGSCHTLNNPAQLGDARTTISAGPQRSSNIGNAHRATRCDGVGDRGSPTLKQVQIVGPASIAASLSHPESNIRRSRSLTVANANSDLITSQRGGARVCGVQ